MMHPGRSLFASFTLGPHRLQNRIVLAPMTRSRATGNVPTALMAQYYGQRASAGLIVTEGTSPSPNGLGYPRIPGVFTAEQLAGWRDVTAAAHAGGAKIFLQLMHTGRIGHPHNLPAGARLLTQEVGWSPAVVIDVDGGVDVPDGRGAGVVVLPGVPGGFRSLLSDVVEPALLAGRNPVPHVRELTHHLSESLLNAAFVALGERFPAVRLGSYPGSPMLVRLTGPEADVEAAAAFMRAELDVLEADPAAERLRRRHRRDA
jgi:hypothetical protein